MHDYISYILHIYMNGESRAHSQEQIKKTRCQCGKSEPTDARQRTSSIPFHINIDNQAGRWLSKRVEEKPRGGEKNKNNKKPSIS